MRIGAGNKGAGLRPRSFFYALEKLSFVTNRKFLLGNVKTIVCNQWKVVRKTIVCYQWIIIKEKLLFVTNRKFSIKQRKNYSL